ncbi:hypothetical protein KFK09_021152 [Dendrobium nobile]|uniref:Malectin-like domain-containing protein n=1 Tax=Dendrobium nobile TaxID=94219 RepID=A0A8T3APJ1_DENNO|nr:hypothetical protein KFK09_021152 [Dendrobium nobile]
MLAAAISWLLFVSSIFSLVTCLVSAVPNEPFAIHISCGAREDVRTKPTNTLWYRDFGYTGGRYTNASVTSSIVPPLQTLRYFPLSDGPENCYNINRIPNGHYAVRIFFALVADSDLQNEPVFDISVDGTQTYSMKPGWSNSEDQSFMEALIFVTKRSLFACFHSTGHGDPSILSIEILQVDPNAYNYGQSRSHVMILRTAKRLSCGTGKAAFDEDYNGDHWGGDRFWLGTPSLSQGSDQSISTERSIAEASLPPNFYPKKLYQSAIISTDQQPDLTFEMDVDPGKNYSIWFHFAEIDPRVTSEEERVFDILVNGDVIFENVDIIRMTGEGYTALVLNRTVAVSGRTLTIILHPTKGYAIINAIEVLEIIPSELRTLPEEVSTLQTLKTSLGLPLRLGWNGDPCVPQQHPWSGVDCQYDSKSVRWVIDGLGLDNQGLKGFLPSDISKLKHLVSINLSGNNIQGSIPFSMGTITGLQTLDLSYNQFNGSIPESLGQLKSLRILNLNGNLLSGRVPANLGGRPLHGASFNFTGNAGLCDIPGLPTCGPHLSIGAKVGIALGSLIAFLLFLVCLVCWWKRRQNILRIQKIAASREASYAKARTNFGRDVQMTKHSSPQRSQDQSRIATEDSPALLS